LGSCFFFVVDDDMSKIFEHFAAKKLAQLQPFIRAIEWNGKALMGEPDKSLFF
jgi:hypothetical protein